MADDPDRYGFGSLLVGLQLGLLALLAALAASGLRTTGGAPDDAWLAGMAGVALGAWAVWANRPGNFNIVPTPRSGGKLVQHGPYQWIRHPMYSALLLAGYAAVRASTDGWAWAAVVAWAALAGVLAVKAGVEERGMIAAHPAYAEYMKRTARFLPHVY
jgi:protein-S-isoprenylcysteine O-methyltransferase Ste14